MKLSGETLIAASPDAVWRALNDPDVLRQCIPGCETLERTGETSFKATVAMKVGPLQARFTGTVDLSDLDPPHGYTITGSGSGGVAGSGKGSAKVRLAPHAQGTLLTYEADAQVAGKLAQLGGRLIDSTAKMMAGQFFDRFQEVVGKPADAAATAEAASRPGPAGLPWAYLAAGAVGAGLLLWLVLR